MEAAILTISEDQIQRLDAHAREAFRRRLVEYAARYLPRPAEGWSPERLADAALQQSPQFEFTTEQQVAGFMTVLCLSQLLGEPARAELKRLLQSAYLSPEGKVKLMLDFASRKFEEGRR